MAMVVTASHAGGGGGVAAPRVPVDVPRPGFRAQVDLTCPGCGAGPEAAIHDHEGGQVVCSACGWVAMSNVIDESSEWRDFADSDEPSRSRVGAAEGIDGSLTLSAGPGEHPRFAGVLYHIREVMDRLMLAPGTYRDAAIYARAALQSAEKLPRENMTLAAAAVYAVSLSRPGARSLRESAAASGVRDGLLAHYARVVARCAKAAGLGERAVELVNVRTAVDAAAILPRLCTSLGMSYAMQERAIHLYQHLASSGELVGHKPSSVAAAVAWVTADGTITMEALAEASSITPSTIRRLAEVVARHRGDLEYEAEPAKADAGPKLE